MAGKLKEGYEKWRLTMNLEGNQYICIEEEKECLKFDSEEEIKPSTECTYLGTEIYQTGDNTTEMKQNKATKVRFKCFKFYLVAPRYYKKQKFIYL